MNSFVVACETLTCCHDTCGISFQVPGWWVKGKRETHANFFCPNGHRQSFIAESVTETLRRERDIARQQVARAEQEANDQRRIAALAQKQKRKLEKRAANGTCPCCQRTFSNMSTHMRKQHPEFVAENVVLIKQKA